MRIISTYPVASVNDTPRSKKVSFGYMVNPRQGELLALLQKEIPKYYDNINKALMLHTPITFTEWEKVKLKYHPENLSRGEIDEKESIIRNFIMDAAMRKAEKLRVKLVQEALIKFFIAKCAQKKPEQFTSLKIVA